MSIRSTDLAGRALGWLLAVPGLGCTYYDWGSIDTDGDVSAHADPFFSAEEWAVITTELGALPPTPPSDPTNRYADDPAAALLGQKFYFETGYSGSWTLTTKDDGQNCATCHDPEAWFGASTTMIDEWRNVPPVVNSAFYVWFLWDGGRDSMWAQSLGPPEQQMFSSRLRVVHLIFEKYRAEYDAVFEPKLPPELDPSHPGAYRFPPEGGPGSRAPNSGWDSMPVEDQILVNQIYVNFGKALAAYQRRLISGNAPFDRYLGGDFGALDDAAKRGLGLFVGRGQCVECHNGPAFTDNGFHNIGVPGAESPEGRYLAIDQVLRDEFNTQSDYSDADIGLLDDLRSGPADLGKFRTKHLRQVAETGRYMHAGQFPTLYDVVSFYADGGPGDALVGELDPLIRPLDLGAGDRSDIVAFLEALTGDPIPAELLVDTSRP